MAKLNCKHENISRSHRYELCLDCGTIWHLPPALPSGRPIGWRQTGKKSVCPLAQNVPETWLPYFECNVRASDSRVVDCSRNACPGPSQETMTEYTQRKV